MDAIQSVTPRGPVLDPLRTQMTVEREHPMKKNHDREMIPLGKTPFSLRYTRRKRKSPSRAR